MTATAQQAQPVSCSRCGTQEQTAPVTWTVQSSARGVEYICADCTRTCVRDIESQLPSDWW